MYGRPRFDTGQPDRTVTAAMWREHGHRGSTRIQFTEPADDANRRRT